ncbi:MAG: type II toxin-antitoxin system RelE/ParE family toxin [Candidatus Woesearchaeota archaeon]
MLTIEHSKNFLKAVCKIKNSALKDKVKKQIEKVSKNPEIGKPMKYSRKGTRELYIGAFRLAYAYIEKDATLVFLELYHKDEQ